MDGGLPPFARRLFLGGLVGAASLAASRSAFAADDPLPSWNDGAAKQSILDFVKRVTSGGEKDFVPPEQRIATFDNDGTLWSEQPVYFQLAFALDQVRAMAPQHPEWKTKEPFASVLSRDPHRVAKLSEKELLLIVAQTHSGMTVEQFQKTVLDWITTAKDARFHRLYTELVFQPMLELLAYLRANEFRTYIVSGGGIEFMRPWVNKVYGIPPEQVIGSSGETKFEVVNGTPELIKLPKVEFIDDGPGKPVAINRFIGLRPILAFGNSDGDLQMLEWTAAGTGARFMGLVHHTDAAREWAYDRNSSMGKLDEAWDEAMRRDWTIVDMRRDWKVIYPFEM